MKLVDEAFDELPPYIKNARRDCPEPLKIARELRPIIEAVAATGVGVFDTLKAVAKQVLTELRRI